jgi:hypothetical protein
MSALTPTIVTRAENMNENLELIDEDAVGILISENMKDCIITTETGEQVPGVRVYLGVLWENKRSPAIDYLFPEDLAWVDVPGIQEADEEEEVEGADFAPGEHTDLELDQ